METRQSLHILEKRAREEAEEDQDRNTKPRTMTNPTKHENKAFTEDTMANAGKMLRLPENEEFSSKQLECFDAGILYPSE
jgi:hypothetical protein